MRSTDRRRNHEVPLVAIHTTSSRRVGAGPVGSGPGRRPPVVRPRQPVPEPARDQPVPALVGVQPVHRPVAPVVGLRVARRVPVQGAEVRRDLVQLRVDRAHPPGQRPGEPARQPEHLRRVGQPHGQHGRAAGGQRGDRSRGGLAGPHRVEPGPERVIDADDDAGDVGPQLERGRQLVALDVLGLRAAHREVVQFGAGQARGQVRAQPRQPPPGAGSPMPMVIESPRVTIRVMTVPSGGTRAARRQPRGRRGGLDHGGVVVEQLVGQRGPGRRAPAAGPPAEHRPQPRVGGELPTAAASAPGSPGGTR